jgi:hypothetical protein
MLKLLFKPRYISSKHVELFAKLCRVFYLAQLPAAVQDIKIQPSFTSARVTWKLPNSASASSYITQLVIYLNGIKYKNISRGTQINIEGLKLFTWYKVEIKTLDGSLQESIKPFKYFKTSVTGKRSSICIPSILY